MSNQDFIGQGAGKLTPELAAFLDKYENKHKQKNEKRIRRHADFKEKLNMYDMILANIIAGTSIIEPTQELDSSQIHIGFSNIASADKLSKYFDSEEEMIEFFEKMPIDDFLKFIKKIKENIINNDKFFNNYMVKIINNDKVIINMDDLPKNIYSYYKIIYTTILLSVISQLGDFAASCIKRYVDIKDYGKMIPGHGGVLDRIDSMMYIAPFAYIMLKIL